MKFIVNSSALLKELQSLSGVLSTSNTLPILDNFLFEIEEKSLTVTVSDLETTMVANLEIEAKESGKVAMPAKLLLDTLKSLPKQPLTFTIDDANFGIEISSDYGKYKLSGFNGEEFPKSPELSDPSKIEITGSLLANAINKTIFATSNDEMRPVMCGVYCQLSTEDLTFVATDAHKLVRYRRKDTGASNTSDIILPKKPVTLLKNLVPSEDNVQIEFTQSNACFTFGNKKLVCLLIDGKYPNYEAVIPKENPNKLVIDRNAFLSSIKRVSIFANKTTNQVRLKISGSELAISAEDLDFSNEANERLTCNYTGEDLEIGFNSKFLSDMLGNLDTENVVFELSAPNRAGLLFPESTDSKDEEILMLVMPVMLNN